MLQFNGLRVSLMHLLALHVYHPELVKIKLR